MPLPITATLIVKNAADKINRALDSVAWCDHILIVDSHSTDNTLPLISGRPDAPKITVISRDWPGFNPQRQFAAAQAPTDWVLMLDADEECSPELRAELQSLTEDAVAYVAIFRMPRRNYIATRHVRCWGPDLQTRFLHKARVAWDPRSLPEIRTPLPNFHTKTLHGPLLHNRLTPYQPTDFNEGLRQSLYAQDLANTLKLRHKLATFLNLLFRPYFTFLKYYLLKGSFLDGRFGLVVAYKTTIGVILKYSVLYGEELKDTPPHP